MAIVEINKPCHTCQHRKVSITPSPSQFTVWLCVKRHIRFGYDFEYEDGVNMPKTCEDWLK